MSAWHEAVLQQFVRELPLRAARWKGLPNAAATAAVDAYVERLRRVLYAIVRDEPNPLDGEGPKQ